MIQHKKNIIIQHYSNITAYNIEDFQDQRRYLKITLANKSQNTHPRTNSSSV